MMSIMSKIVVVLRHILAIVLFPIFIVIALCYRYYCYMLEYFEYRKSTEFLKIIGDVFFLSLCMYVYISGSNIRIWGP